jgi:hypothetical protein
MTAICQGRYHRPVGKLIKIALIILGILAFLHWRKNRRAQQEMVTAPPVADPADELRRRIAESRDDETTVEDEPPAASVAERRTDVHEHGRAALDEMKPSDEG